VADPEERFYLAALTVSLGRAGAARELAAAACPREAFARLADPRADPALLRRQCDAHGIRLLTAADDAYPALLRDIADAPPVLYARGNPAALVRPGVAVVGARRCTRTGAEVAASLAASLAARGMCVISGLARGIDAAAHRAAVGEGATVAVIGSGLARPYPSANRGLVEAIVAAGGLLLSEYPPWQGARRHHFPERNRLISGIAMGVVVVEAGERSGSLITARMAAEQGREVCAVPGPVTSPVSRGCHRLIQQGAALVECAEDVLEALGFARYAAPDGAADPAPQRPEDDALARILAVVEGTVTTLDEIVAATGVAGALASAALVELELSGFVRQVPGGYIRRPLR
jgi:DNA processing protein